MRIYSTCSNTAEGFKYIVMENKRSVLTLENLRAKRAEEYLTEAGNHCKPPIFSCRGAG